MRDLKPNDLSTRNEQEIAPSGQFLCAGSANAGGNARILRARHAPNQPYREIRGLDELKHLLD